MLYTFQDVDLADKKALPVALTKITGIGFSRAVYICNLMGFSKFTKIEELNVYNFFILSDLIKEYYGVGELLKRMRENRLRGFLAFKSYKAIRYAAGLPIRGQHTHTNAKTAKNLKTKVRFSPGD